MSYNTEKRNLLLNFLRENSQNSYTVDELCQNILSDGHGKSTIYRLVSRLCDEGLLKKTLDPECSLISYQYMGRECHEHLHLKCNECGRLIHLDSEVSHSLYDEFFKNQGFELDGGAVLFGKCELCRGGV